MTLALFDLTPDLVQMPQRAPLAESYDLEAASGYAFLYTSSERGNSSGIRFAMSVDDAMVWCSSEISKGVLHGTRWSYFWTRVSTFITYKAEYDGYRPRIDIAGLTDSGEWDDRIASLGLRKFHLREFAALFAPMGVEIVGGDR